MACCEFVSNSVADLLRAKAIMIWPGQPRCVSPLNVATRANGKQRLILDLRHVNDYLMVPKFRMESLSVLTDLADLEDLMFSLDLASGYHQVDIDPRFFTYLGFEWKGTFYAYTVLPFGLASAPWCFTKIMRSVSSHLRFKGLRLINYLDDFLFLSSLLNSSEHRALVLSTFKAAGLAINTAKSHLDFSTRLTHLGFVIDLGLGRFEVPEDRWSAFQSLVAEALAATSFRVRLISRIAGHISSMLLALGPIALIRSRQCHSFVSQHSLNFITTLPLGLLAELQFWSSISRTHFSQKIWPPPFCADLVIWCDAGAVSWGAYLKGHNLTAQGFFPPHLTHTTSSSTLRELWGFLHSLQSFAHLLKDRSVQVFSDNYNVVSIIQTGSTQLTLNEVAILISAFTTLHNIVLLPTWVPREQNQLADSLTHVEDFEDWSLHPSIISLLYQRWGTCTIDRFASFSNHTRPKFNSLHWCPGSVGVNALAQTDWQEHFNWCNPPFHLIPPTISMLRKESADAILIVPFWPSSPWWPLLSSDGQHFIPIICDCFVLPRLPDLFLPGPSTLAFPKSFQRWDILALYFSPKQPSSQPTHIPHCLRRLPMHHGV